MQINTLSFKQPKPFWVLALGELWNTFSYYGTQTILVLYLVHIFHFNRNDSYLLYATYAAFAYSLPILGGILADKWLGSKNAILTGSVLNIIGNLMLISLNHYIFCLGLATSLIGLGLYKSNATYLVGTLYQDKDIRKETGFTWFYLAINVGGVLGPLFYGFIIYAIGWNFGFLCSALGIFITTIWLLYNLRLLQEEKKIQSVKISVKIFVYFMILTSCLFLSLPFYIPALTNLIIFIVFFISIPYLIFAIKKYSGIERKHLIALILISFFAMFYFAVGLQVGSTITLFIQSKIQQGTINTHLPASIFSTFYPLFVLLLAPFFTYLWGALRIKGILITPSHKVLIGLLLAAAGIIAFALASLTSFVMTDILLGYLLLSAGELALTPAIYTAISDFSPSGMKSTMMGCWFLFIALGAYLSSSLANTAHFAANLMPFHQSEYFGEFLFIAGFTFVIALILMIFIPRLSKMMP